MGFSVKRAISKGTIRGVWNSTFGKMDFYKRSKRGKYIMCNPFSGNFIQQGPGLDAKQLDRMKEN